MKRVLVTSSLAALLVGGAFVGETEASYHDNNSPVIKGGEETRVIINPGSGISWKHYYTDWTLNDGWYEKWYYYTDGAGTHYKAELYNANGKLQRTRYL